MLGYGGRNSVLYDFGEFNPLVRADGRATYSMMAQLLSVRCRNGIGPVIHLWSSIAMYVGVTPATTGLRGRR